MERITWRYLLRTLLLGTLVGVIMWIIYIAATVIRAT
jgi:hypothetical protein